MDEAGELPEAPPCFWSPQVLSGLRFQNHRLLLDHLKIEALKCGFDIASRQALLSPYGHFHCTKGGRVRAGKTGKCGCPFGFSTTTIDGQVQIRMDTLRLEHNHELVPELYMHRNLPPGIVDTIRKLHLAGVKPMQIKAYMEKCHQHLSTLQIQYVTRQEDLQSFEVESEGLIGYMSAQPNSVVRTFESEVEGRRRRFAVLTFTEEELNNLRQFGDVIFIDGTMTQLRVRWEVLPITAVDQHKEIVCCGIVYVSLGNEEVLTWMLRQIWDIAAPMGRLRTIITDEDQAFAAAFRTMTVGVNHGPDHLVIHHVLCALHKQRNFTNKLMKCGLSKLERDAAVDLFRKVCYHTNVEYVDHCLEQLKGMNEKLCNYMEKHVVPLLPKFAKAYMNGIHAIGYNTTSPAESMNNLLKHGVGNLMSLRESREHFNRNLRNHNDNRALRHHRRRFPVEDQGYMPAWLFRNVGAKIAAKILKQTTTADAIVVEPIEGDPTFTHRAYHRDHGHISYRLNPQYCNCNTVHFLGIPCSHLIRLYRDSRQPFPANLIHPRWRIEPPAQPPNDGDLDQIGADRSPSDEEAIQEETSIERELELGLEEEDAESDLPMDRERTERELYLRIFHIGKNIASKACKESITALRVVSKMREILAEIVELPPEEGPDMQIELQSGGNSDAEVEDVIDNVARPRGRPRRIRNGRDRGTKTVCRICGNGHQTSECVGFNDVQEAAARFRDYSGTQRRCGICTEPGHNARSCAIKRRAVEYYERLGDD